MTGGRPLSQKIKRDRGHITNVFCRNSASVPLSQEKSVTGTCPLSHHGEIDIMKKIVKMENLECAHCAAKMEKAINDIDGVVSASVSFMAQKLIIEADSDIDDILRKAQKIIKKIEPDCELIL